MIRFDLLDRDGTYMRELTGCLQGSRIWRQGVSRPGHGYLAITYDHADVAFLQARRFVRCHLNGTAYFTWMLQNKKQVRVGPSADARVVQWDGDGAIVYMGMGDWGGATVLGQRGYSTHGWVASEWDETGWVASSSIGTQGSPTVPTSNGVPERWPVEAANAHRIMFGPLASNVNGGVGHDSGPYWFREEVNSAGVELGEVRVFASADDGFRMWVDGEQRITAGRFSGESTVFDGSWRDTFQFDLEVNSPVQLAALVRNGPLGNKVDNPASLLHCGIKISNGELGDVVWRSQPGNGVWTNVEPDGVTWGYVIGREIAAAQAGGRSKLTGLDSYRAIPAVSTDVTDTVDSAAVAWAKSLPIYRIRTQELLGDAVEAASEAFEVDYEMAPNFVLKGYESLGTDRTATVILLDDEDTNDPAMASVAAATVDEVAMRGNAALVLGDDGEYGWLEDPVSVAANGRVEVPITVGTAVSLGEALRLAPGVMARELSAARAQSLTILTPTPHMPLGAFAPGDLVSAREVNGGGMESVTVDEVNVQDAVAGEVDFDVAVERRL